GRARLARGRGPGEGRGRRGPREREAVRAAHPAGRADFPGCRQLGQYGRNERMTSRDGFETLAIHAGQEPDPLTGAVVPPIYQVSTYKQDGVGGLRGGTHAGVGSGPGRWVEGYEYSRTANPTRGSLEDCLAALEGGARALAFASGMAAEDCLFRTVCK